MNLIKYSLIQIFKTIPIFNKKILLMESQLFR